MNEEPSLETDACSPLLGNEKDSTMKEEPSLETDACNPL